MTPSTNTHGYGKEPTTFDVFMRCRWPSSVFPRAKGTTLTKTPEIIEFMDDHFFRHSAHRHSFHSAPRAALKSGLTAPSLSALAQP